MTLDPKRWEGALDGALSTEVTEYGSVIVKDGKSIGAVYPTTLDGTPVPHVPTALLFSDAPDLAAAYVRLTAENARLRQALTTARDFVTDKRHGTAKYYEGSDVYFDLERVRVVIDAALSGDAS